VLVLPDLVTRAELYDALRVGLPAPIEWLSPYDREVILLAAAHEAITDGLGPPFALRAPLVREMLDLYDQLRRHQQHVDDFERLLVLEELENRAPFDRGAERMLRQTRFLIAAFRSYERRVQEHGGFDEHALREHRLADPTPSPYRRLIVTVGDRVLDAGGLWPADFDLAARLPGLEAIDVVSTEAQLASGWHERVHSLLPGIEEVRFDDGEPPAFETRVLAVPDGGDARYFTCRDREDEIADTVRRIKARHRAAFTGPDVAPGFSPASESRTDRLPSRVGEFAEASATAEVLRHKPRLDRTAVVFARPLPYLYLSRGIFASAGVPVQCDDALPLAAEPVAAALDLALAFVASLASRPATVALLRSPHYALGRDGVPVSADAARALDQALARVRYAGDPSRLVALAEEWATEAAGSSDTRTTALRKLAAPALDGALLALDRLLPLFEQAPASRHLRTLRTFVAEFGVTPRPDDPIAERHLRARTAVLALLDALADGHERFGDLHWTVDDLGAIVRSWIERQTFTPRSGNAGVHLADAAAARYGRFDDVYLVGLVEGEWPERPRRNLFYSTFLLGKLGWADDRVRLAGARAAFADLLRLGSRRVTVSTFLLEDDSLVDASSLLADVTAADLQLDPVPRDDTRIFAAEAMGSPPVPAGVVSPDADAWLALRLARTPSSSERFHGTAAPHRPRLHAAGALELYVECPFRYFARHVLRLEEEIADEDGLSPRDRGIFVHEVFQRFFERWHAEGRGAITPDSLDSAYAMLGEVGAELLERLPGPEGAIERTRLFGSPVAPGLADIVFEMEATRPVAVVDRRLEDRFEGVFELAGAQGSRAVPIRGIVDRIDLLADGSLRVIDYKASLPPRPVQLAIYASTTVERLGRQRGRDWRVGEAAYLVYGAQRGTRPLARKPADLPGVLADAQARAAAAVDGIERGAFPPRPVLLRLCATCAYAGVCRKDHVAAIEDPDTTPAV
jgi:RecB family exonuclease